MADEKPPEKPKTEEKPKEEKPPKPSEGEAAPTAATAAKTGSSMLAWGVIAGVCIVMLVAGAAVAWFILPGKIANQLKNSENVVAEEKTAEGEKSAPTEKKEAKEPEKKTAKKAEEKKEEGKGEGKSGAHGGGGEGAAASPEAAAKDFILQDVLVNIAGTRGARYIKASIFFEAPPHVRKELEDQRPKVIDLVSQVLSNKSIEQLTADDSRGILRAEILKVVNSLLPDDKVNNIYFLDFIIQ